MDPATGSAPSVEIDRAKQVFRFLKAFAERSVPIRRTLRDQLWQLPLRDLPNYPTITIGEVVLTSPAALAADDDPPVTAPLLSVRRPDLMPAPPPPAVLSDFLRRGWEEPDGAIEVEPSRNLMRDGQVVTEAFDASSSRVTALARWKAAWSRWAEAERPARVAMTTFERLYELRARIERDSETVELILGDGRLRWLTATGEIDHPVLLQRVELAFDPSVPEFRLVDTDRDPELYGAILQAGEGLSSAQLNQLRVELERGGYHPLARDGTQAYLRSLATRLGPRGEFRESIANVAPGPDPLLVRDPVLFLRTRVSGFPAAFDRVLEALETATELPPSLTRLVGVEAPPSDEAHQDSSSPWGEPLDVLLSKPANPEQIQIARALERHRAVLVQGPPGTGKSHTIANLIGHLVAHGQRVLVTSHTTKALRVLRDQIVEPLRPLCVAMLDQDLESRSQMEHSVRGILARLTQSSEAHLRQEAESLAATRGRLNAIIEELTAGLRQAREAEFVPIVVDGEAVAPSDAARLLAGAAAGADWVPGPVAAGAPLPVSAEQLLALYESNASLSPEDEHEIDARIPPLESLTAPVEFARLSEAARSDEPRELAAFWERAPSEAELPALEALAEKVRTAAAELSGLVPWQRRLVAAGHGGQSARAAWDDLERLVSEAHGRWERGQRVLMEHSVSCSGGQPLEELRQHVTAILAHVGSGGRLGAFQLLFRSRWKAIIDASQVDRRPPATPADFRALLTHLDIEVGRQRLSSRWQRQAVPAGLTPLRAVGSPPEPALRDLARQFGPLCSWWPSHWRAIEDASKTAGFRWQAFRDWHVARSLPTAPFERDATLLTGPLLDTIGARAAAAQRLRATRLLKEFSDRLGAFRAPACDLLRDAVGRHDVSAYDSTYAEVARLTGKLALWNQRGELLRRIGEAAPNWAKAIRLRAGLHGTAALPGDPTAAWRLRQLQQEIDRRAALDEVALARRLHDRRNELRVATADLIDRRAWLSQTRRTDLKARQALQGWADTTKKIGKGTGKRVPELQAKARALLEEARSAVPVWIMPLSRVAESFDPASIRFDVVIVDEASQSDVTALLAWYLGDRIAVVGDHEQVSPMAVGQEIEAMRALIAEHLGGIPNSHLYDGATSIYDLARQSFGGTIALREHFRCVPDIIEFSNELSYDFEIRPLRNPATAPRPHVVEYVVDAGLGAMREGKTNLAEARCIVALLKGATEMPEYEEKSFGAITLLGDEQAGLIQNLAGSVVGAVELERRRFVAGNSAQFQGDERHVVFLSMVDVPRGKALPLLDRQAFKQRYNVAASRAKDQLWLVHSLDPGRDLQEGDLRRRLIEYVRNPGARRRALQLAEQRAESPFERAVLQRLIAGGYRAEPQVWVGRYRIDVVVGANGRQVAVECDGDRFHGVDQIPADLARQAVLERAGWHFVRIRGTRFYRDPAGTMDWVREELDRLGIRPDDSQPSSQVSHPEGRDFRGRVTRRAWEIMRDQGWLPTGLSVDASAGS